MSAPITLSRPLATRVNGIPELLELSPDVPNVSDAIIRTAMDALHRGETHYTDRAGVPELRKVVAARLNLGYDLNIDAKEITITCGVAEARFVALRVLSKPGTEVVCADSSLTEALSGVCQLVGARLVPRIGDPANVSVLYTTPNADPALIEAIAHTNAYIVYDLSAHNALFRPHPAQNETLRPRVTTLDGLEDMLPGWRVGWLAGSDMAEKLRGFKQTLTICTTSVSQWAAIEALKGEPT